MTNRIVRCSLALSTALSLSLGLSPAGAQTTPGDQSGTPSNAGPGQSAASSTNAPAMQDMTPPGGAAPAAGNTSTATAAPRSRSDDSGAADIIVTARRVEERLQDVPISITVFNQQQLTNRNVVQAQDLATYTPSLSANNNFGSLNSSFAIRGFVQDIGTQPSVGVYFADVVSPRGASNNIPIGDGAGPGNFFDLQNVQVLKGPQGTLFGRNTTGGAILLVPQKPTSKLEGYVEGSYGNYDLKRIQGVVNVPLGDSARFRVGVDHEQRDGYLKNDTASGPRRFSDIDYTAIRGSLVLDLAPDLENYTIVSYVHSNTVGDIQKVISCNPSVILNGSINLLGPAACAQLAREKGTDFYTVQNQLANPKTRLTQWQIINTTTWRATDDLTIKNIVSYAQLMEDYTSPIFGTDFRGADSIAAPIFAPGARLAFTNATAIPDGHTSNQSTFTDEFQLQGTTGKLNWQTGAYAELSDPLGVGGSQSPLLIDCTNAATFNCVPAPAAFTGMGVGSIGVTKGRTNFRNYGLYAQGTYTITDQLKATGGFRYTFDRVRNSSVLQQYNVFTPGVGTLRSCFFPEQDPAGFTTVPPHLTPGANCGLSYRTRSSKPTWLIDLDYKPTEDILFYAKYARGYRAGGITPGVPQNLAVFRPEKVNAYEVGAKTQVRGPLRATFNVAGFYNDFRNQQLQVNLNPRKQGTVPGATAIQNADKSRIFGAEIESSITPFTGLTLDVSYTYLNTKLKKFTLVQSPPTNPYFVDTLISEGDPLTLSPKNKVSATGTYTLPLDEDVGRISFGATFTHIDHQLTNYATFGRVGHRNLLNLNASWNSLLGTPIDLSAFATNVTQRKYLNFVAGNFNAAGFETAVLGEPRMYGVRLRYRFGG